ncbi:MAG: cytochrome c3 family protein, partial [Gemmatimonadales bacterium]
MKTKRKWLAVPGFLTIAAAAAMLSAYAGASSSEGNGPAQPVAFPHTLHAGGNMKINCVYCHFSATKSPDPGLPAVGTCMGCHTVVATDRPEVKKLAGFWDRKQPVPWVRIHKLPEYVHFPHMR